MAARSPSTVERPSIPMADRVYARAFALTVRGQGTLAATDELLELAQGDAHVIGAAREQFAVLAADHPESAHADRALALVTHAWLAAIAAARASTGINRKERAMRAKVGDRLIIKAHHVGEHDRDAEVLDVRGPDGAPPWIVRWEDSDHDVLFFPGPDAVIEPYAEERLTPRRRPRSIARAAS